MRRLIALPKNVTGRERLAIGLGVGIVVALWCAARVVPYVWRSAQERRERIETAVLALARAREALVAEPAARESLGARASRLVGHAPRLFAGTTPAEAQAELSGYVAGLAAMRGVRLVSQDARTDSAASLFTSVTLRTEAEGDITGIAGWLAALEEGDRLLDVRTLAITAPEPAAAPGQPERLRVQATISAWSAERRRGGP
jgi:hypothetical protein